MTKSIFSQGKIIWKKVKVPNIFWGKTISNVLFCHANYQKVSSDITNTNKEQSLKKYPRSTGELYMKNIGIELQCG